jgi:hypothetical protein
MVSVVSSVLFVCIVEEFIFVVRWRLDKFRVLQLVDTSEPLCWFDRLSSALQLAVDVQSCIGFEPDGAILVADADSALIEFG